jgi:hypothetical protein
VNTVLNIRVPYAFGNFLLSEKLVVSQEYQSSTELVNVYGRNSNKNSVRKLKRGIKLIIKISYKKKVA